MAGDEEKEKQPPAPLRGLVSRLENSGFRYFNFEAEATEWLFRDSLALGDVAILAGQPGVGKGWLAYQLAAHLSAGLDAFGWRVEYPWRTLYLTAEENQNVVHRRARAALLQIPPGLGREAAGGLQAAAVRGNVSLVAADRSGFLTPSANFPDLDLLLETLMPGLVVLDTFSRFFPINENDNGALTISFSLLEELAAKHKATILVTHHCSKVGSIFADSAASLKSNLSLQSIRGGSAISGCVRWAAMLVPLTAAYAGKLFGPEAEGRPDGCYVAGRVIKKNEGPGEEIFYLRHGEGGLFEAAAPAFESEGLSDAEVLAREVERRHEAGEAPLAATRGGRDAFLWGGARSKKATEKALEAGLLRVEKKQNGKGNVLVSTKVPESPGLGF
jgi:RecA-family ATPase